MTRFWRWSPLLVLLGCCCPFIAHSQLDPVKRELLQIGYNAALEGHAPQSAYAFYYLNTPEFLQNTNLALRIAVAPTYMDSEVGFKGLLGQFTDLGIGIAGGGYADNYREVDQGQFIPDQSFLGYGGEASVSIYHLFNPDRLIPLNGVLRGIAHYSTYADDNKTANNFELPDSHTTFSVRTGLRWGGREPTLYPDLAMELSVWYLGEFRSRSGEYGFNDRTLEPRSHTFWGQAMLAYTLPELKHNFYLSLIGGTGLSLDRFSTYRLGALLPLVSEYPLPLPGYYYQEISATDFILFSGDYTVPLDKNRRWNIDVTFATAAVDYLNGLQQPGHSQTGVGAGILYKTPAFKIMVGYGYGVNAIRSHGRGANAIGVLMQLDWGHAKENIFSPSDPGLWRGLEQVFGLFGN